MAGVVSSGSGWRAAGVLTPPAKGQRHAMPQALRKITTEWRNRIETTDVVTLDIQPGDDNT